MDRRAGSERTALRNRSGPAGRRIGKRIHAPYWALVAITARSASARPEPGHVPRGHSPNLRIRQWRPGAPPAVVR